MTWDVTVPAGSSAIRSGDDAIREFKVDVATALSAHGTFPGANPASPVFKPNDPPSGSIMMYAGASAPTGWLFCDGSSVLRANYPDLFTAISTAFGSVDGTHFTLPDMRGKTAIGVGTGAGLTARSLADTGGEETHVLTTGELAAHNHTVNITDPGHTHIERTGTAGGTPIAIAATTGDGTTNNDSYQTTKSNTTGITAASVNNGSGTAHNNMQPFVALNYMIKT